MERIMISFFVFFVLCFLSMNPWFPTLLILSFYLFSFISICFTRGGFAWRNYSQNPRRLPGPVSWPFVGFLPQMGSQAHRKLASLATSLGSDRLMAISLGTTRVIVSSNPETAREILSGHGFCNRPIRESARLLMFERAIGFSPCGDYWRHLRRIAANHMLSPKRIANLEGLRQSITNAMIEGVCREMSERGSVEMRGILQKGSLHNVLGSVFGSGLGLEGETLGFMVKEGYELISEFNWADYFPLGFLDFHGVRRRCHKLAAKVNGLVSRIINERKNDKEVKLKSDFLSVLLSLPQEEGLSDADMVAVLWEMVFRGTDTVSTLLEWIMARMVIHQDIQAKAQDEVDKHIGHKRLVQDSDIANLPYLQAIVKEVLRLHPPGPLLSWARLAIQDVHVDKHFIPVGTIAMVNMWAITHDASIWTDPWAFRPERFIEEDVSIMGSDLRLAPFGSGRRVCPGKALGLATVNLWLARFLQRFRLVPYQPVDLSECLKLSLEMKKPLVCLAVNR